MLAVRILGFLALAGIANARPGLPVAHYQSDYGFASANIYGGHGGGAHGHYQQPGVAKVESHLTSNSYNFGLDESGPHYNKHVHQSAHFNTHLVAVPAVAVKPVVAAVPVAAVPVAVGHSGYGHPGAVGPVGHLGGVGPSGLGHAGHALGHEGYAGAHGVEHVGLSGPAGHGLGGYGPSAAGLGFAGNGVAGHGGYGGHGY